MRLRRHISLIAVALAWFGGPLPADQQGQAASTPEQPSEDTAQSRHRDSGNDFHPRRHQVESALLRGDVARHNGNPAEALCWYLQAYLKSPAGDDARRSARNLIGAWGSDLKHTLVHDQAVKDVAVDPEGRILMAGYLTTSSQLWNLSTGKPIGEPQRHYGSMMSAEISPDGTFALTCDWEGAKVWDVGTGELRYPRLEHMLREDTIVPSRISPDGKTIITRPSLDKIRLWDAETGEPRGPSRSHGGGVSRMVFSPDSQTVASLGGAEVRLWNAGSAEPIGEPLEGVIDVAFDPESRLMATAGSDGKLRILEIESGRTIAERRHDHPLRSVQFDPTGRHLLTYKTRYFVDRELSEAEEAWLWLDAAGANPVLREVTHGRGLFSASLSPNGRYLLTVGVSLVRVFELSPDDEAAPEKLLWDSRALPSDLKDRSARVKSASFGPDSRSLLVMMEDDTANVYAVGDGRRLVREHQVNDAAFTADGQTIAFGDDQGLVRVRALHTSDPRRLPAVKLPDGMGTVRDVAFSPDGRLALVAGKGAQLYRTQTWEPVGEPLPHEWEIIKASFSPDGRTVVTSMWGPRPGLIGTSPGRLRFWDVASGEQIGEPIPLDRSGSPLVFDATGDILLAGEWLCKVRTRELIERRSLKVGEGERAVAQLVAHRPDSRMPPLWDFEKDEPTRLRMPEDDVVAARLTPDAQRLLATRRDGSSRLWDAETGEPLGPRFRAEGSLRQVSPDGKSAVFVGRTTLRLWDPYTGRPRGESLINQQANVSAAFSPSGDMLATLWHWTAQLRDSGTGQALTPLLAQPTSGGGAVLFTPDGQELLVLSQGVQRWRVPAPAEEEPERLKLSVEIRTGLEIDENGVIQKLTRTEWLERQRRLEQLGGPCDVAEW